MDKPGVSGTVPTSRPVLCCSAKSWTRVLGWMHIALAALELLVFFIIVIPLLAAIGSRGGVSQQVFEDAQGASLAAATISLSIGVIGICLLTLVEGILLVKGVSEENPSKLQLQCWLIIEWILIAFAIITVMMKLGTVSLDLNDFVSASVYMIAIPPSFFCIWVVNVHRKELLNAGRTGSIFGSLSWSQNQHQLIRIEEGGDGDDSVLIK